jgi:hypothetical protein
MDDSCFFLVLVLHAQVQRKKKATRVYSGTRVWRHTLLKELVNTLYTHTYIIIYFNTHTDTQTHRHTDTHFHFSHLHYY